MYFPKISMQSLIPISVVVSWLLALITLDTLSKHPGKVLLHLSALVEHPLPVYDSLFYCNFHLFFFEECSLSKYQASTDVLPFKNIFWYSSI